MSTYGGMQTNIATLLRRTDLSTEIQLAIKRAVAHYSLEPWPWLEERNTSSLVTVSGTRTVAVPSDYGTALSLSITISGTKHPVRPRTFQEIEELYFNTSTGQPQFYSYYDEQFFLYPIPDGAYTLTLDYYEILTELSGSTDTNAWTTTAEEMIEARAMWWLARSIMRNDMIAGSSKERELDAYSRLRSRAVMQASSGHIRSSESARYRS